MARETNNTNRPETIFDSLKARVIANVSEATADNTYISTVPEEMPPNPDDLMFELSPGPNVGFDEGTIIGGGLDSLSTWMEFRVTVHVISDLDQSGRDEEYLKKADTGVFPLMREVIKAICIFDPVDVSNNEQLSQPIMIKSAHIPPRDERHVGYFTVVFAMEFDWDMS